MQVDHRRDWIKWVAASDSWECFSRLSLAMWRRLVNGCFVDGPASFQFRRSVHMPIFCQRMRGWLFNCGQVWRVMH